MRKTHVILSGKTREEALLEGARSLDLDPEEAAIQEMESGVFIVSMKDSAGQFEIVVSQDKMAASVKFITPPFGAGAPVTAADIERSVANLKIVFGINRKAIADLVASVAGTGRIQSYTQIASGESPVAGNDAGIELRVGRDAINRDSQACNVVRQGQVIAVKLPASKPTPGRNIFGKEVPAKAGADVSLPTGENVTVMDGGKTLIAATYGVARVTPTGISVSSLVEVSSDKMWAQVPIFPTLADNSRLTLEHVMTALKQAGVVHGIKKEALEAALTTDETIEHFIAAEGTPARDGIDARMEFKFRLSGDDPEAIDVRRKAGEFQEGEIVKEMVFAGEILAVKIPAQRPLEGKTVTGNIIKGVEAADKKVTAGMNVTLLDDGLTYVVSSGASGYADYVQGTLYVEDPVRISEDKMQAYLSVHPRSGTAKMLTPDLVERLLSDHGVVYGIDREAIELAFGTVASSGVPLLDHRIAQGSVPKRGEDGRIEFKFQARKSSGTLITPDGQMDYKERHAIENVKAGEVLATKIPPTPGKDGTDVLGFSVLSEPGAENGLVPIGNVAVSDDGPAYIAEIDGMVTLVQENKIGVFKEYRVDGDVDFSTGNLTVDGSLDIKGWIRSGFTVLAKGAIRVGGGIEDATVEAGADLYINGGVIGAGQGKIRSGGDIRARFFENASVQADSNVFARDSMLGCSVRANGKVLLTEGKGCVRGGSIEAIKGIEVKELGAEVGLKTFVSVGEDTAKIRKRVANASKALKDFQQKREKIEVVLARYLKKNKTKTLPRETLQKLARLNKLRRRISLYETRLIQFKAEMAREIARIDGESVTVNVERMVYSGTTVSVKGFGRYINEDIRGKVRFLFRPEEQVVEILAQKI